MDDLPSAPPATGDHPPRHAFTRPIIGAARSWIRAPKARGVLRALAVIAVLAFIFGREDPAIFLSARDWLFRPVPTPTVAPTLLPSATPLALRRPLHVPVLAPGSPCPTVPGRTVEQQLNAVVGEGPVYVALGKADTLIYAPPQTFHSQDWGGQTMIWAVQPGFDGLVLVRGHQVDGPNEVGFGQGAVPDTELLFRAPTNTQPAVPDGWTYETDYTRVRAPGCYGYQIDGETVSDVVIFQAVPAG